LHAVSNATQKHIRELRDLRKRIQDSDDPLKLQKVQSINERMEHAMQQLNRAARNRAKAAREAPQETAQM